MITNGGTKFRCVLKTSIRGANKVDIFSCPPTRFIYTRNTVFPSSTLTFRLLKALFHLPLLSVSEALLIQCGRYNVVQACRDGMGQLGELGKTLLRTHTFDFSVAQSLPCISDILCPAAVNLHKDLSRNERPDSVDILYLEQNP